MTAAAAAGVAPTGRPARRNAHAAALVVAAVVVFAVNDAAVKLLTARLPPGEIVVLRGLFVTALLLLILPLMGLRPGRPDRFALLRSAAEVGVNLAFVLSLPFLALGDAYTLYFAAPIMLTAAAALFLHEPVGPRRWAAVLAGFAGVVIAVGAPGTWQAAAFLPLGAAALSVARDFATRSVAPEVNAGTVALATAIAVTLGGLALPPYAWTAPTLPELALCLLAAAGAGAGYVLFALAVRVGDLSFIAPFRYAGVPAAMLLGLLVWGDVPSAQTLLGGAIIVGSGLFILGRERDLARRGGPAPR